jgi:hypothetical protein
MPARSRPLARDHSTTSGSHGWPIAALLFIVVVAAIAACGQNTTSPQSDAPCDHEMMLTLDPAGGVLAASGDTYLCLGFDGSPLDGRTIQAIRWRVPGGVHHATIFSTAEAQEKVTACTRMPDDAVPLHVWAPGGEDLELDPDTGLVLAPGQRYLLVELHLASLERATAAPATVAICSRTRAPKNRATWLGLPAPVPAIRPWQKETSTAVCRLADAVHLLSTWPHMHARGLEFHGAVATTAGRIPLVDVPQWNIGDQRSHPLNLDLPSGSTIETTCIWENRSAAYVLPGRDAANEMCVQGLIGYPAGAMRCTPDGP